MRGWVSNFPEELADLDLYLYHLPQFSFASSELNLQGAMAVGLPIVVMPSTGIKWMFEHKKDAMVAENPKEAKNYCVNLSKHHEERIMLGQNAQKKVFNEYGMENMLEGYLNDVYPNCRMRFAICGPITAFDSRGKRIIENAIRLYKRVVRYIFNKITVCCRSVVCFLEKTY
jgi:hypothetical protein